MDDANRPCLVLLFQIIVGILLKAEPLYIQGVNDPSAAAQDCFVGAGIYAFFVVATSLLILRNKKLSGEAQRETYGDAAERTGIANQSRFGGGYGRYCTQILLLYQVA
jgi:hypothetical protein